MEEEQTVTVEETSFSISDVDKRIFLKLIGGTSIFLFLFTLFNKKTGNMLFKDFPGQSDLALHDVGGNKIDPAQNQPMDGYRITDIDDDVIAYYGFTNKEGAWYMMRIDTNTGAFRYARGKENFKDNWGKRKELVYDYFSNIF